MAWGELTCKLYSNAKPFPHAVIDGFWNDELLNGVLGAWPDSGWSRHKNKHEFKRHKNDNLPTPIMDFFDLAMEPEFLDQLSDLTSIRPLLADPSLRGGGLHEIPKHGLLGIHTDFTAHEKLWRRVNMLVFLNRECEGGDLILGANCDKRIEPKFNRTVIFNAGKDSWHGHPEPWCLETPRRSLAVYYYSDQKPEPGTEPQGTRFL